MFPTRNAPWLCAAKLVCCCLTGALLITGCGRAGDAAPVVEIGVIAPFEGLGRPLGYAVLPAIQEVLSEANSQGGAGVAIGGTRSLRVALVALNDDLYGPTALAQAEALAQHQNLVGAVGLWSDEVAMYASPALRAAGIPVLVPIPAGNGTPGIYSLCPSAAEVAAALVERAIRIGETPIILAGAPGAVADAVRAAGVGEQEAGGSVWVDCIRTIGHQGEAQVNTPEGGAPAPATDLCADPCAGSAPDCRATVLYTGSAAAAADDLVRWRTAGWQGAFLGGPELARPWLVQRAGNAAEGTEAVVCSDASGDTQAGDPSLDGEAEVARAGTEVLLRAIARDVAAHGVPTRAGVSSQLLNETLARSLGWLLVRDGRWVAVGDGS